ncbi:MAG: metallophosphoesterase [Defluviitaleaceae bacterium]|nr:metallophosphoesterase [Defluviitaleaceae bacterium]MCL2262434.1 metallophosphoesterase [Defluviitaleaceae bacterium]
MKYLSRLRMPERMQLKRMLALFTAFAMLLTVISVARPWEGTEEITLAQSESAEVVPLSDGETIEWVIMGDNTSNPGGADPNPPMPTFPSGASLIGPGAALSTLLNEPRPNEDYVVLMLELSDLAEIAPYGIAENATLTFNMPSGFQNRRILAWTNLSAGANYRTVTHLDHSAMGTGFVSVHRALSATDPVTSTVSVPANFLFRNGNFAEAIFITMTNNANATPEQTHRGRGHVSFSTIELNLIPAGYGDITEPPPPPPEYGYIFDIQSVLGGFNLGGENGNVIARSAAYAAPAINNHANIRVTHAGTGSADGILVTVHEGDDDRYLTVTRTGANATRGLLFTGVELREGDIMTVSGYLETAGLHIRLQSSADTGYMPPGYQAPGAGSFTHVYTVSAAHAARANQDLRILAHNSGIPATFTITDLTIYRPDDAPVPFAPGVQAIETVSYEFTAMGLGAGETATLTFATDQFQLRSNIPAAGIIQPESRAFTVDRNGTDTWDIPFEAPSQLFLGWSNMGQNHTITGSDDAYFTVDAFIVNGIRLEPNEYIVLDGTDGALPNAFGTHGELFEFARCSCGNARLERRTRTSTIPVRSHPSAPLTESRSLVMFVMDEDLDECIVPPSGMFWGISGGAALHLPATTAHRGNHVTVIPGPAGNNDPRILRFADITFGNDPEIMAEIRNAGTAAITIHAPGVSGNRQFQVWTSLSALVDGAEGDPSTQDFVTTENVAAGAILNTGTGTAAATPWAVTIPANLLYNNGVFADAIYLAGTLGGGIGTGNFRFDHTNAINYVTVELRPAPPFQDHMSLNWGEDETEMRITWWTPRSVDDPSANAVTSFVQYAPYETLVDGAMPADAPIVDGHAPVPIDSNVAAYRYNVSRVNITNLASNTRFAYRVGNRVGNAEDGPIIWSRINHFYSFEPHAGHTVILVGDPQIGAWNLDRQYFKWRDSLTTAFEHVRTMYEIDGIGHGGVDFILSAGDNSTPANDMGRFQTYLRPYQLRSTPMFTTIGNHDTVTQNANLPTIGLLSYAHYWPNHDWLLAGASVVGPIMDGVVTGGTPGRSTHSSNYARGGGNHWFVYGDVLYISLNMNLVGPAGFAQHVRTLQQATDAFPDTTWRIVTFHQDIFGSGTGHAAGMPASNRQSMGAFLNAFDIDLVINGHEHTHGRSYFMNGATPVHQQRPADFAGNRNSMLIYGCHPGAFISPEGIPYITLGSISDFPKYTSIFPLLDWVAWTDPPELDYMAQYSIMVVDGDSITIETWAIPYTTGANTAADWQPCPDRDKFMSTSITIRRTARFEDLDLLLEGASEFVEERDGEDITPATWTEFAAAVAYANTLTDADSPEEIHDAFMEVYDLYFALEATTDKADLIALVTEVQELLDVAVEGPWFGQFPPGSITVLRDVFEPARHTRTLRLATQNELDVQYDLLRPAFTYFISLASDIALPWTNVHTIPADGEYELSLVSWMCEYVPEVLVYVPVEDDDGQWQYRRFIMPWENHPNIIRRFPSHFTKLNFAGGSLRAVDGSDNHHTRFMVTRESVRPDSPYGPVTMEGGRVPIPRIRIEKDIDGEITIIETLEPTSGHVTHTHAGEWIRYELYVEEAGEYSIQLGARNPRSAAMVVALRDMYQNTLTRFTIPAGHGATQDWEDVPLVPAANTINLPQGTYVLEIVFFNDGTGPTHHGTGNVSSYTDGPDVDMMVLQRVGDTNPDITFVDVPRLQGVANIHPNSSYFMLPMLPNDAAGNSLRQRGWAMAGTWNEWVGSNLVQDGAFTLAEVSAATHLVMEVAGRPSGAIFVGLMGGHAGTWNQHSHAVDSVLNTEINRVIIDLRAIPSTVGEPAALVFDRWTDISDTSPRRIMVSHNAESWDEMNVVAAWLVLDETYDPGGTGPHEPGEVIWELEITQELVDALNNEEDHGGVTRAGEPYLLYSDGNLVVTERSAAYFAIDVLLRNLDLNPDGRYRVIATGSSVAGASFIVELPLADDPWHAGRYVGDANGATWVFSGAIPDIGGVTPGLDGEGNCNHRVRVLTTGMGDFTIYSIVIERIIRDDATILANLIQEALALLADTEESVDGYDVPRSRFWATNAQRTAFSNVITAAQLALEYANASNGNDD